MNEMSNLSKDLAKLGLCYEVALDGAIVIYPLGHAGEAGYALGGFREPSHVMECIRRGRGYRADGLMGMAHWDHGGLLEPYRAILAADEL